MAQFFYSLYGWMPPVLQTVCIGAVFLFFLVVILRVVKFILDIIPFL